MKYKRRCIICEKKFETNHEEKILCGNFFCKQERQRQRARHNMELKRKK